MYKRVRPFCTFLLLFYIICDIIFKMFLTNINKILEGRSIVVMKRSLIGLFLLLILLISGCTTQNQEIPIPKAKADVYVYDEDNLFDESAEKEINDMLISLEKKTSSEFVVVTVKSLLGKEIENYSIKVANGLGIGKKEKDNGVLLLMSRSDKCVRLEIGKGLEGILNDAKCGRILDEYFVPHRENDEYAKAIENMPR